MARYISEFSFVGDQQQMMNQISEYLYSEGYEFRRNFEGEDLFKKGKGIVSAPTFVKVTFFNGSMRIEAWVKYALLPGVYVDEMDLEGFVGCAVKKPLKHRVEHIEGMIMNFGGQRLQPMYQPQFQQPMYQQVQQPVYQQTPNTDQVFYCHNCGQQHTKDEEFCSNCGTKLNNN